MPVPAQVIVAPRSSATTVSTAVARGSSAGSVQAGADTATIGGAPSGARIIESTARPAHKDSGASKRGERAPTMRRRLIVIGTGTEAVAATRRDRRPSPAISRANAARARAAKTSTGSGRPSAKRTDSKVCTTRRAKRSSSSLPPGATGTWITGEKRAAGLPSAACSDTPSAWASSVKRGRGPSTRRQAMPSGIVPASGGGAGTGASPSRSAAARVRRARSAASCCRAAARRDAIEVWPCPSTTRCEVDAIASPPARPSPSHGPPPARQVRRWRWRAIAGA